MVAALTFLILWLTKKASAVESRPASIFIGFVDSGSTLPIESPYVPYTLCEPFVLPENLAVGDLITFKNFTSHGVDFHLGAGDIAGEGFQSQVDSTLQAVGNIGQMQSYELPDNFTVTTGNFGSCFRKYPCT